MKINQTGKVPCKGGRYDRRASNIGRIRVARRPFEWRGFSLRKGMLYGEYIPGVLFAAVPRYNVGVVDLFSSVNGGAWGRVRNPAGTVFIRPEFSRALKAAAPYDTYQGVLAGAPSRNVTAHYGL